MSGADSKTDRLRHLVERVIRDPASEESRTAAVQACRLIRQMGYGDPPLIAHSAAVAEAEASLLRQRAQHAKEFRLAMERSALTSDVAMYRNLSLTFFMWLMCYPCIAYGPNVVKNRALLTLALSVVVLLVAGLVRFMTKWRIAVGKLAAHDKRAGR